MKIWYYLSILGLIGWGIWDKIGIIRQGEVYTFRGRCQLPDKIGGPAFIWRKKHCYKILTLRGWYHIALFRYSVKQRVIWLDDDRQPLKIPYEPGVPFRVDRGSLVYQQRVKKPLGFIWVDQKVSTKYPDL